MDVAGAKIVHARIAERQWRSAPSVRDGRQPQVDPDLHALELVDGDLRSYGLETASAVVNGVPTVLRRRLTKRLVDGAWESSWEAEHADPASAAA